MESDRLLYLCVIRSSAVQRAIFSISIEQAREGGRESSGLGIPAAYTGPHKARLDNYDRKLDTIEWHDRRE